MTRRRLRSLPTPAGRGDPPARSGARITGPLDLARAVPYLLGFHPYASLVLIGLRAGRVLVTARMDLADAAAPPPRSPLGDTMQAIERGGGDAAVAVLFEDLAAQSRVGLAARDELLTRLYWSALACELELYDVVQLGAGRWRSLCCSDDECCPPEGVPIPATTSQFAAAAVLDGLAPLPDRGSIAARFTPLPAERRAALAMRLARVEQSVPGSEGVAGARYCRASVRTLFAAARASAGPGWDPPSEPQAARLAVALACDPVRLAVWDGVDDQRLDGRPLWLHLSRCLPATHVVAPLLLYGWSAWRCGDGAAAAIAVERLHAAAPRSSEADLLAACLHSGIDPRRIPPLRLPAG